MPALPIDFSEDELAGLRAVARERGTTVRALVRRVVAEELARQRSLDEAADVFRSFVTDNAAAFADAFPEDAPGPAALPSQRRGTV